MKKYKIRLIKGISQILFPITIFIISFILQILYFFLGELDPTENIFHFSVLILFFISLFQYRKEKEENKIHYLISYWIVAIIFLAKFLFGIMWYLL